MGETTKADRSESMYNQKRKKPHQRKRAAS